MMLRRFSPVVLAVQFLCDLALTAIAVKLAEQARLRITTGFEQREQFVAVQRGWYLLVVVLWAAFFVLFGAFDPARRRSLLSDLGNVWVSVLIATLSLASVFYLSGVNTENVPSRLFYAYFLVLDIGLLTAAHVIAFQILAALYRRGIQIRRVLLVGAGLHGRHVGVRLRGRESSGLSLVGYLSGVREEPVPGLERLGSTDDLLSIVQAKQIDEVVVALPAEAHVEALTMTADLQRRGVNVRVLPDVFEMVAMRARVEDFYGLPLISISEPSITPIQARVKRAFDLFVAGIVSLLMLPFMAAIALWIRLDSSGPILIHQRRVGAGGVPFRMHKFRTMKWDPAAVDAGYTKQRGDPRVTRAGKLLRRASLDELPQLWNVVRGEMSLVGPRPELPSIVELYEPWQLKRLVVPPGMTGWWQVSGRSERAMHLNTEIDLYYVQNYSILLDVQILLRTLGAVIKGKGAF